MEDNNAYADLLLQQQLEAEQWHQQQQQQAQQQTIHPAPVPYPRPPHSGGNSVFPSLSTATTLNVHGATTSGGQRPLHHPSAGATGAQYSHPHHNPHHHHHPAYSSQHAAVRHNSANQASDTLRRRSVTASNNAGSSATPLRVKTTTSVSSSAASSGGGLVDSSSRHHHQMDDDEGSVASEASFRFSGLEMPSTPLDVEAHNHHHNMAASSGKTEHYPYYHSNAGVHHHAHHSGQQHHHSLSSIGTSNDAPRGASMSLGGNSDHDEEGSPKIITPRRRRSSFTPQHQLDRRNSRRRVTSHSTNSSTRSSFTSSGSPTNSQAGAANATTAPNRYYISGKSVQTEWSSPTRQRRSRTGGNSRHNRKGGHGGGNPNNGPMDDSSHNSNSNMSSSHHQSIDNDGNSRVLVLPSISIPNGSDDYHRHHSHPSQIKPPAFPQRRACVQASSVLCSVGTFKWCVLVQIVLVIPLCLYVFDAHAQKRHAKLQLQQYNEEHEHILNQMMWMDQAAKKITATKSRYQQHRTGLAGGAATGAWASSFDGAGAARSGDASGGGGTGTGGGGGGYLDSYYADNTATEDLRDSVHKLRGQMRDMQYRIQQNSKERIIEKYGEGPLRVYIHPEAEDSLNGGTGTGGEQAPVSGGGSDNLRGNRGVAARAKDGDETMTPEIGIELYIEDTPHAVSTFLYQIERGHWNRVQMNWRTEASIVSKPGTSVTSGMGEWSQTSRLEFLEQFPMKHCEVSLVQQGQMGVLSLKINLVEVPFQEHEEVCIGRLLNDRLTLPKSRGYFMAEFTTNSNQPEDFAKDEQLFEPPEHQPPPPLPPILDEEDPPQYEGRRTDDAVMNPQHEGRRMDDAVMNHRVERERVDDEDELPHGQQVVPPLQEPQDEDLPDGL